MNSQLKSVGNFCLFASFFVLGLGACAVSTVDRPEAMVEGEGSGEVSLSGDRKSIEELRKNIPEPVKTENDLLRETMELMGEVKERPDRIRSRFQRQMRKIRQKERREARKLRDRFRKDEKKKRDNFLKSLKKERDDGKDKDMSREERREFYGELDAKRKEFFSEERDKRKEFESEQRQRSGDFSAMLRDRNREFNREYRIYKQKYDEMIKAKRNQGKLRRQGVQGGQQPGRSFQPLTTDE